MRAAQVEDAGFGEGSLHHVERIVRPVRARQSWKLRTRRELLAHLELAYGEELARGSDSAGAIARATSRLGDPASLRSQLQQSVPLLDRVFLSPVPVPRVLDRVESRTGRLLRFTPQ